MSPNKRWAFLCVTFGLVGCASTGGGGDDNYSTINGGDRVQEVRPDIFLIVSKSGFYIPDGEVPWMVTDKLMSKLSGQGPAAASFGSGLAMTPFQRVPGLAMFGFCSSRDAG